MQPQYLGLPSFGVLFMGMIHALPSISHVINKSARHNNTSDEAPGKHVKNLHNNTNDEAPGKPPGRTSDGVHSSVSSVSLSVSLRHNVAI